MPVLDPTLFLDVADSLGIENPVIVEKDYYAVQLLKELSSLSCEDYHLVFAGGTCLAKAYKNTYRMSEDIDLKLVSSGSLATTSREKKRQKRRDVHETILSTLKSSSLFKLIECKKRNEGRYQQFLIEYPINHPEISALRPHLQLELTESTLLKPAIKHPIYSLYAEIAQLDPELKNLPCATIESIASEKFIALLRRVAAFERDNTKEDDETLIRHVYDLHLIKELLSDVNSIKQLVKQVIQIDIEHFGNQSNEFRDNPIKELNYGLQKLIESPLYKERYDKFIGPLVYHPSPASWNEAINTISELTALWL
jgi:predicted nucleotidyltransferase component of viral defense system